VNTTRGASTAVHGRKDAPGIDHRPADANLGDRTQIHLTPYRQDPEDGTTSAAELSRSSPDADSMALLFELYLLPARITLAATAETLDYSRRMTSDTFGMRHQWSHATR